MSRIPNMHSPSQSSQASSVFWCVAANIRTRTNVENVTMRVRFAYLTELLGAWAAAAAMATAAIAPVARNPVNINVISLTVTSIQLGTIRR
jgi:hypothetical protein